LLQRFLERGESQQSGGARERTEHSRISYRFLIDRKSYADRVAQADAGNGIWEAEFIRLCLRCQHHGAARFHTGKNIDCAVDGGVDADNAIGMVDVRHRPDRLRIAAQKGSNRGAAALESERGDRDRMFAVVDQRLRENRACQDGKFAETR
jgi:hypothetical protein